MRVVQSKLSKVSVALLLGVLFAWPETPNASEAGHAKNRYAAAIDTGVKVEAGDYAKTIVYFGAWNLVCDHFISGKRRVCVIEQIVSDADVSIQWRLALTTDGKPFLVFDVSSIVDHRAGLVMRLGKFVTTIPFVSCTTTCTGEIAFDRFIEEAMTSGEIIAFGYTKAGLGVAVIADTRGFKKALEASAKPPSIIFDTPANGKKNRKQ
ncbi:hypothetical protein G6L35_26145 [Agrobacterium tumefaciens]|uniref:invasion associated locus B family protein n=1 Tax=Agrobacterium tumefaciens TaxID=358 RepID=UPI001573689F|nr:hypothetical protein [Agrobacterium tumefaciens]NSZ72088.1 hypothetical protein [Agrobacterium tumefaciens]